MEGQAAATRPPVGLRFAAATVSSLLLCVVALTLLVGDASVPLRHGDSSAGVGLAARLMLEQTVLQEANASTGAEQVVQPKRLSFYEKFMERLYKLSKNDTKDDGEVEDSAIPAVSTRVSALNIANNLAQDWVVRNPHDFHPFQFCAEFTDLTAKELRECIRHLMKPIELARQEPISHNGTNASVELALETNHTFNVSAEGGWDACYEAFEDETDKETCLTFVTNKLEGDLAYACTDLDTDEQRYKCRRVTAAVGNIKQLIERQAVVPGGVDNATLAAEDSRMKALKEMREQEKKTEEALSKMEPDLKKMLQKTIDISDESNDKLTAMEQAINDTLVAGPQTPVDRLGPMPGPFGELPGKEEHAYMVAKALAANRSAEAAAAEAASNETDVDLVTSQMHAIIKRNYNGVGDANRAIGLMKAPGGIDRTRSASQMAGHVTLSDSAVNTQDGVVGRQRMAASSTETLLQVGGGMAGEETVAGRLQGLAQLEKLARYGNLGDLDSIMDGSQPAPTGSISPEQIQRERIAAAFGDDGNEYLHHDPDSSVGPKNLGALLSREGHIQPDPKLKSAANIASQFNTDAVTNIMNFANEGSGREGSDSSDNVDLLKVIRGDAAMDSVTPSKDLQEAGSIAEKFGGDGALAGRLAANFATGDAKLDTPAQTDGFDSNFVRIYKKLMSGQPSQSKARADMPSGELPINAHAVQRALEPHSAQIPESGHQAWLKQWAQETRHETHSADASPRSGRQADSRAHRHWSPAGARQHASGVTTQASAQGDDIDSLWSKLLDEEAEAKAAKHEAAVAKRQAAIAARTIEEKEKANRRAAVNDRNEAKVLAEEAKAARDERDALMATRKADQAAHTLAQEKFAQMQRDKRQAKAVAHAAQREEQVVTASRSQREAHVTVRPTRQKKAPNSAGTRAREGQHEKSPHEKSRHEKSTPRGGGQEAAIVATVKQLEKNAEEEPVVTSAQRVEQQAEIREAKQLLHQAAQLKKRRAIKAAIARQAAAIYSPQTPPSEARTRVEARSPAVQRVRHHSSTPQLHDTAGASPQV